MTCAVAHDGQQALEIAQTHRPDVVFLDIGLPIMSGYEVAKLLRENPEFHETLLVALTGYDDEEDRRRVQEASPRAAGRSRCRRARP